MGFFSFGWRRLVKTDNTNAHEMNLHGGLPFEMVLRAGEDRNTDAWHMTCRGLIRAWVGSTWYSNLVTERPPFEWPVS